MKGKIIRGIGGFYYVQAEDGEVYECRAKGIFRKEKIKPLPGDNVEMSVVQDGEKPAGNVDAILPRQNVLIRPAVANVDQALVIFAAASPKPNLNLLDRFLISMEQQHIPVVICFNKADLSTEQELAQLEETYRGSGCEVHILSVAKKEGIEKIQSLLNGKTTVVAGPSGVGKSSLTNLLQPACSDGSRGSEPEDRAGASYDTSYRADLSAKRHILSGYARIQFPVSTGHRL